MATTVDRPASPTHIMRLHEVIARIKVSPTTLWRLRRKGQFPPPFRLSPGLIAWHEVDVERWIASRGRADAGEETQR